jgi:hypothetical protein
MMAQDYRLHCGVKGLCYHWCPGCSLAERQQLETRKAGYLELSLFTYINKLYLFMQSQWQLQIAPAKLI